MLNILAAESIPRTLGVFVWASNKFREATVLKRKVRAQTPEDPLVLVGVTIIKPGASPRVSVLLKSEAEALLESQPLKDGFHNWELMSRVAEARSAVGIE